MKDILALTDLEDTERRALLTFDDAAYGQVAAFCNRYPDVALEFGVTNGRETSASGDERRAFTCAADADEARSHPSPPALAVRLPLRWSCEV